MRFITVYIITLLVGLSSHSASAAPAKEHSHDGRTHTHILPATGLNHFHKHLHNGRAHIHPYSAKIGFKHNHNQSSHAQVIEKNIQHKHAGRPHSHPLPRSGTKHQHKHRHGNRSHIHPFDENGQQHFHQLNTSAPNTVVTTEKTRTLIGFSAEQQMDVLINTPSIEIQKAKLNQNTPSSNAMV
ncbi:MAG: hypothetical protein V7749_15845, partial [Cocleimonas sp.]